SPSQCESEYAGSAFVDPVFDYGHNADPELGPPNRCSITGGYVVRDPALADLYGRYLYSDYCSGVLRSLRLRASAGGLAQDDRSLGLRVSKPVSFGEDAAHRLYVVEQGGQVLCFADQPGHCQPAAAPAPRAAPGAPAAPGATATVPTYIGIKAQ